MSDLTLTKKDFTSDQEVRWCPGCGDYSILSTMQSYLPEMGIAKENIELGELYFRQAQKRYLQSKMQQAQTNSQQNAQIQQASMQAKAQGDAALEDRRTQAKQREIIIQGMFDLAKANIPLPQELQPLVQELLVNIEVPLNMDNQQMQMQIQAQAQAQAEAQQQAQMQQQPQEENQQLQTA